MPDMVEEYRTIASGAGWIDRSTRGRLRFAGPDAVSFLQALLSNDVARLSRGAGIYTAYLNPQGRMVADLDVLHRGDWLLACVADGLGPSLAARFDGLIFSEDVKVTDVSGLWSEIAVVGGRAPQVLARALAIDASALAALPELAQADAAGGFVVRVGAAPFPMFHVFAAEAEAGDMRNRLGEAGAIPITTALAEALRLEAGRPLWGRDLTADTIPLEAGLLERAISTTKGCYVGQEIIIRILHRGGGRVARRLAIVSVDAAPGSSPEPGATLLQDGQIVGQLTSVAYSPARQGVIAFAYVHRDAAETGKRLALGDGTGTAYVVGFTS